jgi:hypothetical protein
VPSAEKCKRLQLLADAEGFPILGPQGRKGMKQVKGDRLYVRLGAAQARRRLKGAGFGVKKIESAGRQRAAIVHTATGQHRRELIALFQDVLERPAATEEECPPSPASADS